MSAAQNCSESFVYFALGDLLGDQLFVISRKKLINRSDRRYLIQAVSQCSQQLLK